MNIRASLFLVTVLCAAASLMPDVALASDIDSLESGDVVRRRLLYRSTRFEITPQVGMTVGDSYQRNLLGGLALNYHLTNEFSVVANGAFGLTQFDTDLATNVWAKDPGIAVSYVSWMTDLSISWVPIFGKFSFFGMGSGAYDFHINGGVGIVNQSSVSNNSGVGQADLEGVKPGGLFQAGVRIYMGDMLSLNFDWKNYFYSRAELSNGVTESKVRNLPVFTVGLGVFLPGNVKISR